MALHLWKPARLTNPGMKKKTNKKTKKTKKQNKTKKNNPMSYMVYISNSGALGAVPEQNGGGIQRPC